MRTSARVATAALVVAAFLTAAPPAQSAATCLGKAVTIDLTATPEAETDRVNGDVILGTADNDIINAGGGSDTICGGAGDDEIAGGDGKDFIEGGDNDDEVIGGDGVDTVDFRNAANPVEVTLNDDGIQNTGVGLDEILDFENLVGSPFDDVLEGDHANNTIEGKGGVDALEGLSGNDTLKGGTAGELLLPQILSGGAGNDTIVGGAGVDRVDYDGAPGPVTVNLSVSAPQFTGETTGTDTISGVESASGTEFNDTLTGSDVDNYLDGREGDDTLTGKGSTTSGDPTNITGKFDILVGGGGADTLKGGAGDDILVGEDIKGAHAGTHDTMKGGDGFDSVYYAHVSDAIIVDLTIAGPQDTEGGGLDDISTVEGVFGSDESDDLEGNAEANMLGGRGGDDVINGRGGADTIYFGEASSGVNIDLSNAEPQNTNDGTDTIEKIENIFGSSQGDTLIGTTGNNIIRGGSGNDNIQAKAGTDVCFGNGGTDTAKGCETKTGVP